jgi:hypothetical protein
MSKNPVRKASCFKQELIFLVLGGGGGGTTPDINIKESCHSSDQRTFGELDNFSPLHDLYSYLNMFKNRHCMMQFMPTGSVCCHQFH